MTLVKIYFCSALEKDVEYAVRTVKSKRKILQISRLALSISRKIFVEKEYSNQTIQGHCAIPNKMPYIPAGAIMKREGSVWLIHDSSFAEIFAMNECTDLHSVRYQTLQDACRIAKPWSHCAKLTSKQHIVLSPLTVRHYMISKQ